MIRAIDGLLGQKKRNSVPLSDHCIYYLESIAQKTVFKSKYSIEANKEYRQNWFRSVSKTNTDTNWDKIKEQTAVIKTMSGDIQQRALL